MGLLGNGSVLNKDNGFCTSGTGAQSGHAGNFHKNGRYRNRHWFIPKQSSTPEGYGIPYSFRWPQKNGGMSAFTSLTGTGAISSAGLAQGVAVSASLSGVGTISSADLSLIISLASALAGTGTISSADLAMIQSLVASLSGTGTISSADLSSLVGLISSLSGVGSLSGSAVNLAILSASITPFTELSPESLAASLLASEVESDKTVKEALRLILSAVAGKVSGAGTSTITIRNSADDKDRIIATVDSNGNRTSITYDVGD